MIHTQCLTECIVIQPSIVYMYVALYTPHNFCVLNNQIDSMEIAFPVNVFCYDFMASVEIKRLY